MNSEKKLTDGEGARENASRDLPGFSSVHMDISKDPLKDFASYAFGTWVKTHPIPSDKVSWGTFEELTERNMESLHGILESCLHSEVSTDQISTQLGDFYGSAMDMERISSLGFTPLEPVLKAVAEWTDRAGLIDVVANLHLMGIFPFFQIASEPDEKNSAVYALRVEQGGLSLPDRDYYIESSFSDIREAYVPHISRMFTMLGHDMQTPEKVPGRILALETAMAEVSRSRTDLRDAERNYNRVEIRDLENRFPGLLLNRYLGKIGISGVDYIVAGQPEYLSALDGVLSRFTSDDIRSYLKWKVICAFAPYLFAEAEDENFDFFSRKLMGREEQEPRWRRAVKTIDICLGEALGKLYVERYFGPDARREMGTVVDDIRDVFLERLKSLTWMSNETRQRAMAKFSRFRAKIGHPEKFRDYSSIKIDRSDYAGNVSRSLEFEMRRQISRVGKPVDRDEWYMTPSRVNAYFSPQENEIVFPAGILQPPFFDVRGDVAVNYGAIGAVISHEITHGYDDQGRKYDENGNLNDWWTPVDAKNFRDLSSQIVAQYSALEVLPGLHVNGELTLGENIADFGGVSIAFEALQRRLSRNPGLRTIVEGFTAEQRFFISWAQVWKSSLKEQYLRMLVTVDPHSPAKFRAEIPVYNHPAFVDAFKGSSSMNGTAWNWKRVTIW